jgi:2-methylcitrate dehydratase PrpD
LPDGHDAHGRPPAAETRQLAEFAAGIDAASLPAEVVERARQVVIDSLACAVAGYSLVPEVVEPIRRFVLAVGGTPEATLVGGGERVAGPLAALGNATVAHTIDYDDTHMPAIGHFGSLVVPTALALCEATGASGAELVAAVVAGFEVGGKVGRSALPGHYQRWHSTASIGGLAAAGAAARALGLEPEQFDMAIGFAADDAGGTRYCIKVGDFSKSLHAGNAAWKGCLGALLAQAGAMGPTGLLEHPVGFYWAYSDERDARRLGPELELLGARWEIMEDDLKAHPCILASHAPIEATIRIVAEHDLAPDDIAAVRVRLPFYSDNHGLNYEPDSAMAARLSIPFCVAVAATDREVGLAQFENERFLDPGIRKLMRRVTTEPDRELNERYPDTTVGFVTLETTAGDSHAVDVVYPRGSHRRPFTAEEHRDKLVALLSRTLDPGAVTEALDAAAELERLDSVEPLVSALVAGARV